MKLIADSTATENAIKNNALDMMGLNELHPLINATNLCGVRHLDFTACKRENFSCEYLRSNTMHIMLLGELSN